MTEISQQCVQARPLLPYTKCNTRVMIISELAYNLLSCFVSRRQRQRSSSSTHTHIFPIPEPSGSSAHAGATPAILMNPILGVAGPSAFEFTGNAPARPFEWSFKMPSTYPVPSMNSSQQGSMSSLDLEKA
ncbi:hypothetical protein M422DRAFT_272806 [Sphaerobolus stellatus SS14]|uniref:Uncharacterized protein n=1 Tax=Sphaerobolus stellatus (strain SS14) TaxID=990650 RepID=A0A0C9TAN3_SPHS4|nr:hypothetical protein M422DRAFT_272806 [Sphaerobolus stellatus SS14]